ncbi:DNA-binding transcriptional response regulator, NtrC family, contains REC, AAA-type ATPase, and a Fis-type DNA-binding domains [Limimonas halophila]|uniref:DNA-binding transcriptional response regulator, NtrC family, contains REC, AAA-type ATPase, and a Fis-type DNA-binding domains n=1 Tax=Limimonas halophila TaxID=1082479 RepID=A0A1G7M444_9PROT|nr:sigma-54 dependent transcriptional regulator [Limimonas halophila]SDF56572.1 DNA-binding transcriptional response regulator, NtrC family, contains REC, AAA-type ATPase, and a Fis-type DNA-binding domains [Limimonas halophila]
MRLLIVGSLEGHIATAGQIALDKGAKVAHVDDVPAALDALRKGQGADLVMADAALDISELTEALKSERISVQVVACGIGNDSQRAVQAIKAGAKEYVPLPPDPEMIGAVLAAVAEETTSFLTHDPNMVKVLRLGERVAPADASILITGESGTGKEVMARHVHAKSKRADKPFISINCAAIPENLLESELFGHEKGAFTGAVSRRIGKFEEAHGGTLLLDEVSEMDPRLQAKLLRAIQEGEIDRVGGNKPVKVNIRLIATTNRDLEEAVRQGEFREDLYFRLNVVTLDLPPLRERPQDIELLARHFIEKYAAANDLPEPELAESAREAMREHDWPGNVRELENAMHRAVLLAQDDQITEDCVMLKPRRERESTDTASAAAEQPASQQGDDDAGANAVAAAGGGAAANADDGEDGDVRGLVGRTVADVERDLILNTLEHCLGNRTHAANILGISIRTLRNKLKAYSEEGVKVPSPNEADRASA